MKKQITINGEKSDWFEKATFILKEENEKKIPRNLLVYAEHLVENYLKKNTGERCKGVEAYNQNIAYTKQKQQIAEAKHAAKKKKERAAVIDTILMLSLFFACICIGLLISEIWL